MIVARLGKKAEWNSWIWNLHPSSFAVFCYFVKKNALKKRKKSSSLTFLRNSCWNQVGFLHRSASTNISCSAADTSSNHKATGGTRAVVKGKGTPEETAFWFHHQASYHLQQVQE